MVDLTRVSDAAAMPLERIEGRADQAVVVIVRSDSLLGDAMLFDVDRSACHSSGSA